MNRDEVFSILDQYGLSAKKSLGQNFLCNEEVIGEILDLAELDKTTTCLEIGPGLGALSEKAVLIAGEYLAVEIDTRFQERLCDVIEKQGGNVVYKDYLAIGKEDLPNGFAPQVILSNLPYYVMTPIILKLMRDFPCCRKMVLMVEEEACDRIFARAKTKQYGPLAVLTDLFGIKKKCFTVDGGSFVPPPNTTSAVIVIERDEKSGYEWDPMIIGFVESAFALRRKTLVNSLSSGGRYSKDAIVDALTEVGKKENVRSEEMEPSDFRKLFEFLQGRKDK